MKTNRALIADRFDTPADRYNPDTYLLVLETLDNAAADGTTADGIIWALSHLFDRMIELNRRLELDHSPPETFHAFCETAQMFRHIADCESYRFGPIQFD